MGSNRAEKEAFSRQDKSSGQGQLSAHDIAEFYEIRV